MELIFATHNKHKLEEVRRAVPDFVEVKSLYDTGFSGEIPETGATLAENASQKSWYVKEHFGADCFADDTGLIVDALDGAPGVYSARYAGENASYDDNVEKLLRAMEGVKNRKAHFSTVISLLLDGREYFFEGTVEGRILEERHGEDGFGYDPVFVPEGFDRTFAQMTLEEKGRISHRGLAVRAMADFLARYGRK